MEVLYVEGVAIRDGPESCVGAREGVGEALTGVLWAGRLSREIRIWVPTLSQWRKAMLGVALARAMPGPGAVRGAQARRKVLMRENREGPWSACLAWDTPPLIAGQRGLGWVREGNTSVVIPR
jgi:hypothetical protein